MLVAVDFHNLSRVDFHQLSGIDFQKLTWEPCWLQSTKRGYGKRSHIRSFAWFRVSGFGFQIKDFGFRILGFGFWVSGFGFRVYGFRVWDGFRA